MKSDRPKRRPFEKYRQTGTLTTAELTRSHQSYIVQKDRDEDEIERPKHRYKWVIKKAESLLQAEEEKEAQEYYRLVMGQDDDGIDLQQKTRVVKDKHGNAYVLSKTVEGFVSLDEMVFENMPAGINNKAEIAEQNRRLRIINEWLKDFNECAPDCRKDNDASVMGEIMIIAMQVYELDLKLANIYKNKKGKFGKIDGDQTYSFSRSNRGERPTMTPVMIDRLPFVREYPANNWLDIRAGGEDDSAAILIGGGAMKDFRRGVNRGILKMILMPDDLAARQTSFNISARAHADAITEYNKNNKVELEEAALNNRSFLEYLVSPEAQLMKDKFFKDISNYVIESKIKLVTDPVKTAKDIEDKFKALKEAAECKIFLEDFSRILNKHADHYTLKSLLNQSFVDDYKDIINSKASERAKLQLVSDIANEAIKDSPKMGAVTTFFNKLTVKYQMQELHKIIVLFKTNPSVALTKMRELRSSLDKTSNPRESVATNSTARQNNPRPGDGPK